MAFFFCPVQVHRDVIFPETAPEEYCAGEYFEASCGDGEVIQVDTALFGRMFSGQCITDDESLGYYSDVLFYMDEACSGRQSCSVQVVLIYTEVLPCPIQLEGFLLANHTCVPGEYH